MDLIKREICRKSFPEPESHRLFHGRGLCFPGYEDLLIDRFASVLLVTLYRSRSREWLVALVELLCREQQGIRAIVLQERYLRGAPSRVLYGELPAEVDAVEDGLRYRLKLLDSQNIGFFPDMRSGRAYVRTIAAHKKVLNLFAYSCSFSVAALAGGANEVVNLDMSRSALDLGKLNHRLNGCDLRNAGFLRLELFRSFSRLRKFAPFDLVICDPPARQGKSFTAERDWPKLIRKVPELLSPGGDFLACFSAPGITEDLLLEHFAELQPNAELQAKFGAGEAFPEADPDKGLRLLHYRIF